MDEREEVYVRAEVIEKRKVMDRVFYSVIVKGKPNPFWVEKSEVKRQE